MILWLQGKWLLEVDNKIGHFIIIRPRLYIRVLINAFCASNAEYAQIDAYC